LPSLTTPSTLLRPKISARNLANVFAGRPRYVLIDTSDKLNMVWPDAEGNFVKLEAGHNYLVPGVKEAPLVPVPKEEVSPGVRPLSTSGTNVTPPTIHAEWTAGDAASLFEVETCTLIAVLMHVQPVTDSEHHSTAGRK
jgi:hypothetical protein